MDLLSIMKKLVGVCGMILFTALHSDSQQQVTEVEPENHELQQTHLICNHMCIHVLRITCLLGYLVDDMTRHEAKV